METPSVTPCNNAFDWNPLKCAIHIQPILAADEMIQSLRPCACKLSGCPKFKRIEKELNVKTGQLVAA